MNRATLHAFLLLLTLVTSGCGSGTTNTSMTPKGVAAVGPSSSASQTDKSKTELDGRNAKTSGSASPAAAPSSTQGTSYGPNSPVNVGGGTQNNTYVTPAPQARKSTADCEATCRMVCKRCEDSKKDGAVRGHYCSTTGGGFIACASGDCNREEWVKAQCLN